MSNINKIFEKVIHKRIYSFLESNDCIYNFQFGFREKHSTCDALISITEKIKETLKNGCIGVGVFVDFQKAFDTVNHEILLRKLDHYGLRGVSNRLIKSYLENRKQYVSINGFDSTIREMKHGVPQGSVLGPLLFLIYINDLHNCVFYSETYHFADDTHLFHVLSKHNGRYSTKKLNNDLKSLNHWLLANKISLNASKTEAIYFREKGTQKPDVKLKINGVKILVKSKIKYLGLILDEYLTWVPHINTVVSRLKRANNLLAIARHYVPRELLLQIYYGQFFSHVSYGCQIWGQNLNETLAKKKQCASLHFLNLLQKVTPSSNRYVS